MLESVEPCAFCMGIYGSDSMCRHSQKSRCFATPKSESPTREYRAEAALNGPVTDRRRRASFTRRIRAARASGPARIGWGEGRGAGWAAWATNFRRCTSPPTPPGRGQSTPLVFRNRSPGGIYPTTSTVRYPGPDLRCPFRFDAIPAPLGWKKTTSSSLVTRRAPGRSASEGW